MLSVLCVLHMFVCFGHDVRPSIVMHSVVFLILRCERSEPRRM
jgi:hypothetical protein